MMLEGPRERVAGAPSHGLDATEGRAPASRRARLAAYVLLALLVVGFAAQVVAGQPLSKFAGVQPEQLTLYAWIACLTGLMYVGLIAVLTRGASWPKVLLVLLVLAGVLLRVGAWSTPPVNEDDLYRYLLDGAAAGNGLDPFAVSPEALSNGQAPEAWLALLQEPGAEQAVKSVNNPHLRTIYPPVAQGGFALAYFVDPWGISGLRAVLQVADLLTLLGVIGMLKATGRPLVWAAAYWCCPLVPIQLIGTVHMDAMVLAAVALAGWALCAKRPVWAAALLGVGVAVKIWPLLLLPVFIGFAVRMPMTRRVIALLVGLFTAVACMAPMAFNGFGDGSGFTAYSEHWYNNAGAFFVIWDLIESAFGLESWVAGDRARTVIKVAVGLLAIALALWPARSKAEQGGPDTASYGEAAIRRGAVLVLVMFYLSPTQFPWYATWTVVLLCLMPRPSLLLYGGLIWLYYLPGQPEWSRWVQHGLMSLVFAGWLAGYGLMRFKLWHRNMKSSASVLDQAAV